MSTQTTTRTLLKIAIVLVAAFIAVELLEGLVGYAGIAAIQAAVVDALLTGTVPGFLLAGGIGMLVGASGVIAVLWVSAGAERNEREGQGGRPH